MSIREEIFKLIEPMSGSIAPEYHPNIITYKILSHIKSQIEEIFPEGYYPRHLKVWAETIKREQGYESGLTAFLKQLGENWQDILSKLQ